jgi:thiamine monophosphate synthase
VIELRAVVKLVERFVWAVVMAPVSAERVAATMASSAAFVCVSSALSLSRDAS